MVRRGRDKGNIVRGQVPTNTNGQEEHHTLPPKQHHIPPHETPMPNHVANSEVPETEPNGAAPCIVSKKKGRGIYKCIKVDMKTNGGKSRLAVNIPLDVLRAVGDNARDLVNFCGFVVRTTAPLNVNSWKDAFQLVGVRMWKQVEDRFEFKDNEMTLKVFVIETMQNLYRYWKSRLHTHYKLYSTDDERLKNIPEGISMDQWRFMVNRFGSPEFKIISMKASANRGKRKYKSTTGSLSFPEFEEDLRDPDTGEKPPSDEIWLLEHTRISKEAEFEWADPFSMEVHQEIEAFVDEQPQMTHAEVLENVLGPKYKYFQGKVSAKKNYAKLAIESQRIQEQQHQKIVALEKVVVELQAQREADKVTARNEMQLELREHYRELVSNGLLRPLGGVSQSQPEEEEDI